MAHQGVHILALNALTTLILDLSLTTTYNPTMRDGPLHDRGGAVAKHEN